MFLFSCIAFIAIMGVILAIYTGRKSTEIKWDVTLKKYWYFSTEYVFRTIASQGLCN